MFFLYPNTQMSYKMLLVGELVFIVLGFQDATFWYNVICYHVLFTQYLQDSSVHGHSWTGVKILFPGKIKHVNLFFLFLHPEFCTRCCQNFTIDWWTGPGFKMPPSNSGKSVNMFFFFPNPEFIQNTVGWWSEMRFGFVQEAVHWCSKMPPSGIMQSVTMFFFYLPKVIQDTVSSWSGVQRCYFLCSFHPELVYKTLYLLIGGLGRAASMPSSG